LTKERRGANFWLSLDTASLFFSLFLGRAHERFPLSPVLPLPRRSALNQRLSVQRLSLYTLDDARSASVERVRLGAKKTREKEEGQAVDFIPIVPFSLNESERNAMALEPLVFECDEALAGVSSGIIMIDASWTALQLCGEEEEECFSFFFFFR
jgi:hypothetical protein